MYPLVTTSTLYWITTNTSATYTTRPSFSLIMFYCCSFVMFMLENPFLVAVHLSFIYFYLSASVNFSCMCKNCTVIYCLVQLSVKCSRAWTQQSVSQLRFRVHYTTTEIRYFLDYLYNFVVHAREITDGLFHTGLYRRQTWFYCWVLDWIGCCTLDMLQDSVIMFRSYRYRATVDANICILVIVMCCLC